MYANKTHYYMWKKKTIMVRLNKNEWYVNASIKTTDGNKFWL